MFKNTETKYIATAFVSVLIIIVGLSLTISKSAERATNEVVEYVDQNVRRVSLVSDESFGGRNRTATSGRMAIGAGADVQLVGTSSRETFELTNDCTSAVYLSFNDDAPQDYGLRINANGGSYLMEPDQNGGIYKGAIRASSSAACNVDLIETVQY